MSAQNLTGRTLGQYELRELLGVGGMGAVYRGYQANLQRDVAVKVMIPSPEHRHDYEARFIREARTAAALEHVHIVPVHDYGVQDGVSYVVMRLLTGGDLAERIEHSQRTDQPLPSLHEVARIISELASALDYAHDQGVIHRDIKARNVMFDNLGNVFLVDFGIAKLAGATSGLTQPGAAVGTPWYMSPEQWQGREITPAVDQYALAIVVYTMLTGKMPFEADTPWELMNKHVHEAPIPINAWRQDLPAEIMPVLAKGMEKAPEKRYASVTAFSTAFSSAIRNAPITQASGFFEVPIPRPGPATVITTTEPLPRRTSPGRWRVIGVIGVFVVIAVAALLLMSNPSPLALATSTPTNTPIPPTAVPTSVAEGVVISETLTASLPLVAATSTAIRPTVPSAVRINVSTHVPVPSATNTLTPSWTPTPSSVPSTHTHISTHTPTPTLTDTPTQAATASPVPPTSTRSPTNTPAPTSTNAPTRTLTVSPVPPTPTPSPIPPTSTRLPTDIPTLTVTPTPQETAIPSPCKLADLDNSGEVDIFDIRLLTRAYGSRTGDTQYVTRHDFDESGEIDILDLRRLAAQYGQTCPGDH